MNQSDNRNKYAAFSLGVTPRGGLAVSRPRTLGDASDQSTTTSDKLAHATSAMRRRRRLAYAAESSGPQRCGRQTKNVPAKHVRSTGRIASVRTTKAERWPEAPGESGTIAIKNQILVRMSDKRSSAVPLRNDERHERVVPRSRARSEGLAVPHSGHCSAGPRPFREYPQLGQISSNTQLLIKTESWPPGVTACHCRLKRTRVPAVEMFFPIVQRAQMCDGVGHPSEDFLRSGDGFVNPTIET